MPKKRNDMVILPHVLALLTGWLGVLIVYLVVKDPLTKKHARKALNFQLSMILYTLAAGVLVLILVGIPLLIGLWIFNVIATVRAIMKASDGELWDYPLAIRFLKD